MLNPEKEINLINRPNKSFGQLLGISPKNGLFLKTSDSEFIYIGEILSDS